MNHQYAHNPLLDSHIFIPDVEAHVWEDGRIYLYGSYDKQGQKTYCSDLYHVYSSDDLIHWTDHGVVFSLADSNWAKDCGMLYAPDCAYRDGWYYLYYCVPDGRCGVAKSKFPAGPFEDVGQIQGVMGIDPAVLIDDDGQAYLYWGQLSWCQAAKLKKNMVEIEPDTITQPLTVEAHEFHEGSSVKKVNGKYYYLFADTHRHGSRPSCLGYAVSDHPMKGFQYGGVIIDNFGCDPAVWNNHGSMMCFQNQWYVFYHRSTHGSEFSRHVCAEPIYFQEDGSIREVLQTTSGAGTSIPAKEWIPAHLACGLTGRVRIEGDAASENNLVLGQIANGDTAIYRYLDFQGETTFSIVMKTNDVCRVELYIDDRYFAELDMGACNSYCTAKKAIPPVKGIHKLAIQFYGNFTDASVDAFQFMAEG
ncbi:MAG: family 43 glycosylhydrolase [Clostridia bacterium]|nr:family 43 glycosylhydrolase [Clostridia bacterium]